jgi:hypothetical protein
METIHPSRQSGEIDCSGVGVDDLGFGELASKPFNPPWVPFDGKDGGMAEDEIGV